MKNKCAFIERSIEKNILFVDVNKWYVNQYHNNV